MEPVTILNEADIPAGVDVAIRESLCAAFPRDAGFFSRSRAWHGSQPAFSALLARDGRVIAHVGVVDRVIRVGGTPIRTAGLQNVFVLPEERGKRLSAPVLEAAAREARERGFDIGLLFRVPAVRKVYAPLGWRDVGDREVALIENGREQLRHTRSEPMFLPLRLAELPDGPIHLHGNDW